MSQEVTLKEILARFFSARVWIMAGVLVGLLCCFLLILVLTPHYRAEMIVSPANPMSGVDVSLGAADDLYALRQGMQNADTSGSVDFLRFENTPRGASVASVMLERDDIKKGLDQDVEWTAERFADYVSDRVRIDPVGQTALRTVSYYHPDKEYAVLFLKVLHGVADTLIRRQIRLDTEGRIAYLNKAIQHTPNPDHKRLMTELLLEQERLRMLVSIDQPYVAAIVEPPSASYKPVWPDKKLFYLVFVLGGAFIGFIAYGVAND